MAIALQEIGLKLTRQQEIDFWFRGHKVCEFKPDIIVEDVVLLELKAARGIESAHEAQLLNSLRATDIEFGLLLNFGQKPASKRFAFDNSRKKQSR